MEKSSVLSSILKKNVKKRNIPSENEIAAFKSFETIVDLCHS